MFDIIKALQVNHKNMPEKHTKPEAYFDVGEIYTRLEQFIYDRKEEDGKYGRTTSDEKSRQYDLAIKAVIAIGRMNPRPDSPDKFTRSLEEIREGLGLEEATCRLILQQVY